MYAHVHRLFCTISCATLLPRWVRIVRATGTNCIYAHQRAGFSAPVAVTVYSGPEYCSLPLVVLSHRGRRLLIGVLASRACGAPAFPAYVCLRDGYLGLGLQWWATLN